MKQDRAGAGLTLQRNPATRVGDWPAQRCAGHEADQRIIHDARVGLTFSFQSGWTSSFTFPAIACVTRFEGVLHTGIDVVVDNDCL